MIPEQKLKIVKALQKKGQSVAMTVTGERCPRPQAAVIGSRWASRDGCLQDASHMILLETTSQHRARHPGRPDDLRQHPKFIKYLLSCKLG
jgi:hypothetical protein